MHQTPHQIIAPREIDLGEMTVRRLLPSRQCKTVGPWIFFDHMGPANFKAGEGISVRPHPHINLATVTYLFDGEILHRDSLGSYQAIRPGDVNLMVAGKGIVHSEREREEVRSRDHSVHGLQLWLGLPEKDEEIDPAFYHYASADIPLVTVEGVPVRVIMGNAYGQTSPVLCFAETLYVEATLAAGQSLQLPNAPELALYPTGGSVLLGDQQIDNYQMAVLATGFASQKVTALEDTRLALIGGEPLGKRYLDWNFASSRPERIEEARRDWQEGPWQGNFAPVPGDQDEFIPLPTK